MFSNRSQACCAHETLLEGQCNARPRPNSHVFLASMRWRIDFGIQHEPSTPRRYTPNPTKMM